MKKTKSEEGHYDFKNAVKGRPVSNAYSPIQTKSRFQEATDMSKAEPEVSTNLK